MAQAIVKDPVKAVASGSVMNFVGDVESATARIDQHLTDIMMAQDFHDLTGQVIRRIGDMAATLEANLVALLIETRPADAGAADGFLNGPVTDTTRTDVVTSQAQVDELLDALGF